MLYFPLAFNPLPVFNGAPTLFSGVDQACLVSAVNTCWQAYLLSLPFHISRISLIKKLQCTGYFRHTYGRSSDHEYWRSTICRRSVESVSFFTRRCHRYSHYVNVNDRKDRYLFHSLRDKWSKLLSVLCNLGICLRQKRCINVVGLRVISTPMKTEGLSRSHAVTYTVKVVIYRKRQR